MPDNGVRISLDQNFSQIAAEIHKQFEGQDAASVIRLDAKGLFVSNSAKNPGHNAKSAKLPRVLQSLPRSPARSLALSIDLEYGNLMVGEQKLSEYVLNSLLHPKDSPQLDKDAFIDLENRVLIGKTLAYNIAVRNDDKATTLLLDHRDCVTNKTDPIDSRQQQGQIQTGPRSQS